MSAALLAGVLLLAGCSYMPAMPGSGTIHVDVPAPVPSPDPLRWEGRPVTVSVQDFADARPGTPGRKVGNVRATVRDLHSTELKLDQDVPALLAAAVRSRLAAEGFRVVTAGEAADFRLDGTITAFSLDVAGRDELSIAADAVLRRGASAQAAWTGAVAEKTDRYAGVSGNSRATIAEYLGDGVAAFAAKLGASVRAAAARSPVPAALSPVPAAARAVEAPASQASPGRLWVHSAPARAKVYIDEVYYGLTPLRVELPAAIVQVRLVLGGFRTVTEKVSVRSGDTTELEVVLEK